MNEKGNLKTRFREVRDFFSPKIIGEVNDVYVKIAKIRGDEIPWHNHRDEDEMFIIISGSLLFEVENQPSFRMTEGDYFVVEKGVNHRVSAKEECHILLVENKSTAHTGDVISDVTKSITDQLI